MLIFSSHIAATLQKLQSLENFLTDDSSAKKKSYVCNTNAYIDHDKNNNFAFNEI